MYYSEAVLDSMLTYVEPPHRHKGKVVALTAAIASGDVQGLAALLDDAKLHSNNSEHAAKYLLGVN
ncbi:MAG: hypothetical protein KGL39_29805 [Patescibacteria group bacterium]|nr:hypothetical protein [Patescibacteria group bacterium]